MNAYDAGQPLEDHRAGMIYRRDTVVREEAQATIDKIAYKVQRFAMDSGKWLANHPEYKDTDPFDMTPEERDVALEHHRREALEYALSALRGIATTLALGAGGVVMKDDETSLSFYGVLHGAMIDRDNRFSVHT